jgi:hypothetical protein
MYAYKTGTPKIENSLLNINMMGTFKKITSPIDRITSFCWCLFFILLPARLHGFLNSRR